MKMGWMEFFGDPSIYIYIYIYIYAAVVDIPTKILFSSILYRLWNTFNRITLMDIFQDEFEYMT